MHFKLFQVAQAIWWVAQAIWSGFHRLSGLLHRLSGWVAHAIWWKSENSAKPGTASLVLGPEFSNKLNLSEAVKLIWTPDLSNIDQGNFIQVLKLATLFSEYNFRIRLPLFFISEQTFGS